MKNLTLLLTVIFFIAVYGCNRSGKAWYQAKSENTITSYSSFLKEYPNSKYTATADSQLWYLAKTINTDSVIEKYKTALKQPIFFTEACYQQAQIENSIDSYVKFIANFPESILSSIADSSLWKIVKENDTDSAFNIYLNMVKKPIFKNEAQKSLEQLVLFPYYAFSGYIGYIGFHDKDYKVPENEIKQFTPKFIYSTSPIALMLVLYNSTENGGSQLQNLYYADQSIELSDQKLDMQIVKNDNLIQNEIEKTSTSTNFVYMIHTTNFGVLTAKIKYDAIGLDGLNHAYSFYIAGTRAQRDAINAAIKLKN